MAVSLPIKNYSERYETQRFTWHKISIFCDNRKKHWNLLSQDGLPTKLLILFASNKSRNIDVKQFVNVYKAILVPFLLSGLEVLHIHKTSIDTESFNRGVSEEQKKSC